MARLESDNRKLRKALDSRGGDEPKASRAIAVVRRYPPDAHSHTKLRASPVDSKDLSVMVHPIVNVSDGEEVEVLSTHGSYVKVPARSTESLCVMLLYNHVANRLHRCELAAGWRAS